MNTKNIGMIGETLAIYEFTKRNIPVLIPYGDNLHYDMVIEYNNKFYKIQVKTCEKIHDDSYIVFRTRRQGLNYDTKYTNEDADFFFLYCIENNSIALIPITNDIGYEVRLRLQKTKNNQQKGIRMLSDYNIDKILDGLLISTGR